MPRLRGDSLILRQVLPVSRLSFVYRAPLAGLLVLSVLAGCAADPKAATQAPLRGVPPEYQARPDGERVVPAVNPVYLNERNRRRWVEYTGPEGKDTIVIDPYARVLYHVVEPGKAMRFGIAVGKAGKGFSGNAVVGRKEMYPSWQPTSRMVRNDPALYGPLAGGLKGGLDNPLGARALYLYRNGHDTYFRIHGTMDPSSIGKATSAGCIRLFNQDIIDMFDEAPMGTRVKVRTRAESLELEGPMHELHTGYVVPEAEVELIAADDAAWAAGQITDPAVLEAQQHAAAVEAARRAGAGN
ncbi:lipoprotein-anchoring transpeptidase ErfK/SrfK [Rhodobacter viridis]|uniref:Lipoprotein-anchoring transpeptidase ErfK/SrfK n=1 Tax=Rhodobacter viridis TaxID=1054202 RepID=A0A318U8A7_9RHOB|nr:lipoprotein-anchoring transpeptidase ErfK/SrfK [Rhodobacter viridis]